MGLTEKLNDAANKAAWILENGRPGAEVTSLCRDVMEIRESVGRLEGEEVVAEGWRWRWHDTEWRVAWSEKEIPPVIRYGMTPMEKDLQGMMEPVALFRRLADALEEAGA